MNFAITTKCNKACDYCFARESRDAMIKNKENMDMTFVQWCQLLQKVPRDNQNMGYIKILGGEPTQHPEFERFLEELPKRNIKATLISNFLFNEKILEIIKKSLDHGIINGFLINSTDLDQKNRIKKFSRNYNTIYEYLYQFEREQDLSCGITFDIYEKDVDYYLNYIQSLNDSLLNIERLRISLPFPGDQEEKNKFPFIHNKKAGSMFLAAIQKSLSLGIKPSIDCTVYPCMFENREEWKYVKKFVEKYNIDCGGVPADLFPDGTVSYCYPLKEKIKVNSNKHKDLKGTINEMQERYKLIMSMVEKPKQCTSCGFFKQDVCHGPCLGQYDLSDIQVGINV